MVPDSQNFLDALYLYAILSLLTIAHNSSRVLRSVLQLAISEHNSTGMRNIKRAE